MATRENEINFEKKREIQMSEKGKRQEIYGQLRTLTHAQRTNIERAIV